MIFRFVRKVFRFRVFRFVRVVRAVMVAVSNRNLWRWVSALLLMSIKVMSLLIITLLITRRLLKFN